MSERKSPAEVELMADKISSSFSRAEGARGYSLGRAQRSPRFPIQKMIFDAEGVEGGKGAAVAPSALDSFFLTFSLRLRSACPRLRSGSAVGAVTKEDW